jgi:CelD/BcsL family acetyltransferase involved in cellulose biosynthesis
MEITFYQLDSLPEHVLRFIDEKGDFFNNFNWFALLQKQVYGSDSAYSCGCLILTDSAGLILAVCPVYRQIKMGILQQTSSLTCFYSPLFRILTSDEENSTEQAIALFKALRQKQKNWHRLVLHLMQQESVDQITGTTNNIKLGLQKFYSSANWYLPITFSDFNTYLQTRNSRLRNTIKRKTQAFSKIENARIEFFFGEDRLQQAEKDYTEVYSDSWKLPEAYPNFMNELFRMAVRQHGLRLAIAYIGKEPIAAQFWIVADQTAYIYKLAYKDAYKSLGIGTILTAELMKYVIETDKVGCVDFLTGDDAYKQDWMTHRRERWGMVIYNTASTLGSLWFGLELIKQQVKILINLSLKYFGK